MGLDMYLEKRTYIGAQWEHTGVEGTIELSKRKYEAGKVKGKQPIVIDITKVKEITEHVGYWRKANAIHQWFVDNVQDGRDECQDAYVSFENLKKLDKACKAVLSDHSKAESVLPTQAGFFFGDTEYGDYYFEYLKETINILKPILKEEPTSDVSYYYSSSW